MVGTRHPGTYNHLSLRDGEVLARESGAKALSMLSHVTRIHLPQMIGGDICPRKDRMVGLSQSLPPRSELPVRFTTR